jgi:hypothetical protein
MTTHELLSLLLKFVSTNSNVVDIQCNGRMSPRLLLNLYSKNLEERKIAAHYFLLVSSILEDRLIGFSENARRLLVHLPEAFERARYKICCISAECFPVSIQEQDLPLNQQLRRITLHAMRCVRKPSHI